MKEIREALSCIKKNDETFFLIPNGSKIMLPLSRSDHSLFLCECLKRYSLYAKKDFALFPVCFRFDSEDTPIEGYPVFEHLEVEQERLARELASRSYESYLAKLRRLAYANEASASSCSLIALPTSFEDFYFHYEDNLLRLGKLSSYAPSSPAANSLSFIRPLLSFSEKEMKKGEEELGIASFAPARDCPLARKEKESFLKATCYGESATCLPLSKKKEALSEIPDFYFERQEDEMEVKDKDGSLMASFKLSELDAHRCYLSGFYFREKGYEKEVLSSFILYWKKKKKAPLQLFVDAAAPIPLDEAWKESGGSYAKKFW